MVFSSIVFLFRFLPIILAIYMVAPKRMKNFILFIGSLIFYAWGEPIYVTLMLFSTVSDFLHGKKIEHNLLLGKKRNARIWLISSITINILVLGFFKYSDFLITIINNSTNSTIPLLNLALPIGISLITLLKIFSFHHKYDLYLNFFLLFEVQ